MEFIHVKGNTWYLDGEEAIPAYITKEGGCILIDSGWCTERDAIEAALAGKNLHLLGIIGTHVHTDHTGNHGYFQEKYQIPVALSYGESLFPASILNLKAYVPIFTPGEIGDMECLRELQVKADIIIQPEETEVTIGGVTFGVVRTIGHSPDHIAVITPDGVICLGDALLSADLIQRAKLPYFFALDPALHTMEMLQQCHMEGIVAHKGYCPDVAELAAINYNCLKERIDSIRQYITGRMTYSDIVVAVCENLKLLTKSLFKAKLYARDLQSFVDYMVDHDMVEQIVDRGVVYYQNKIDV